MEAALMSIKDIIEWGFIPTKTFMLLFLCWGGVVYLFSHIVVEAIGSLIERRNKVE